MVESSVEKKWYVVRVQSGREEQVRDALLKRVQAAGLVEQITGVVVPTEKVTEIRSGKKRVRDKKLYPGYLMIEMLLNENTWFLVRETSGIGDFLGLQKPHPMQDHEVQKLLRGEEDEEEDEDEDDEEKKSEEDY